MLRAGLGAVTRLQALQTARYSHLHFTVPDDEGSRIPFVKSRAALRRLGMTTARMPLPAPASLGQGQLDERPL
jgi:hypothetical protein